MKLDAINADFRKYRQLPANSLTAAEPRKKVMRKLELYALDINSETSIAEITAQMTIAFPEYRMQ